MIIICPSCEKKFELDQNLIPENGRLLQCGSCNNEWFYRNNHNQKIKEKKIKLKDSPKDEKKEILINDDLVSPTEDKINHEAENIKGLTIGNILSKVFSYLIVLIISSIAIIIILDTFEQNLILIFPNLELILYNLFESIKDIKLFVFDLLR